MLRHLLSGQRAALWYAFLVICVPVVTLLLLGLVQLWQSQWLLGVSVAWLLITLTGFAVYKLWPEKLKAKQPEVGEPLLAEIDDASLITSLPGQLEPRPDWTALDERVWRRTLQTIEQIVDTSPDWPTLPDHGVQLLSVISQHYSIEKSAKKTSASAATSATYSFTLPEMLLLLSVTSSRYRQLLLSHVPFADRIRVSSLLSLYSHQGRIMTGAGWLNTFRRTARFANPLAAITAELRDQFTHRIFTNLSDKVQNDLKRLLLQELSQVAMDLYSGRLKHSTNELADYISHDQSQDTHKNPIAVEPIRVVIVGQVRSGKSSLVNALVERMAAETGILPTTDKTTVHVLQWNAEFTADAHDELIDPVHLIDTIGLTDDPQSTGATATIAQQADLVLWVTRATQPARAVEAALYAAMNDTFASRPDRRPPPVLLVVTHVDQLSPKTQWNPPYDLTSDDRKAQTISLAVESCKRQIGLPDSTPVVPVCLAEQYAPYNIDVVAAQIIAQQAEATQVQLNRRRTEKDGNTGGWRERWDQASKLGTVTGKLLIKSIRL